MSGINNNALAMFKIKERKRKSSIPLSKKQNKGSGKVFLFLDFYQRLL
jgi:hypothetical protein